MAQQRLHSALAPIDVLTREEMEEIQNRQSGMAIKERYRGIEGARLPPVIAQGNGGTINLFAGGGSDGTAGPEQGDVWLIRRVIVTSSAFASDPARYVLFRGSTPSDPGQYTNRQLFDAGGATGVFGTPTQPAVPASTVAQQNPNAYPVVVVISGGSGLTAVTVNGVTVGTGDGTYTVPAGGTISVTYSVTAPTWVWSNQTPFVLGQQQGVAIYPSNKAGLFLPGEQLYAQVFNTTAGNSYILGGEAIRVPAEMKGKVLA